MSTTFTVLPGTDSVPTVSEVLERTDLLLTDFLAGYGIKNHYRISFTINDELPHTTARHKRQTFFARLWNGPQREIEYKRRIPAPTEPFTWTEDKYGWLTLAGVAGGCDCYVEEPLQLWEESCWSHYAAQTQSRLSRSALPLEKMYKNGREWDFRRSAGQPAVIHLTYGLLAASVAQLTNGVLDTIDGAWSYDFPVDGDDFLKFYFRPENMSNTEHDREWAQTCIERIRKETETFGT